MGLPGSASAAFLAVVLLAAGLAGCASTDANTGAAVTSFDSASTADRFRKSGARETTLRAFCKNPPPAATPAGDAAIKASCIPRVLAKVGDARVFDKGSSVYPVVFAQPIRNGDICDADANPQSLCGNFALGDKMRSSRIDAG